jgi:ATP-dependent DNA helicase RecG
MTGAELQRKLEELLTLPAETEWVEFKRAAGNFDFDDLGKYFSALSNEANLKGTAFGWLVFGVQDNPRVVVGSQYRPNRPDLDALKQGIAEQTSQRMTFVEIHELITPEGRVVMFQIPAALRGVPTAWKGHFYGRDGESIGPLNLHEIEQIRAQAIREDWSVKIIDGATLADLDPQAIQFARAQYQEKHPQIAEEIPIWEDATFLNKAKLCIGGKITNTALLLLGKNEASHFLAPAQAWITWVLRDEHTLELDYRHFGPPFILASDQVLGKIRNLTIRHLPNGTLFPLEVTQYDPWVLRETLHNCIAHQDYPQGGRINIVESPESVLFTNLGSFIPGTIEKMIQLDAPPEFQRNPFLAQAMVNLNMIDTIGSGIKRMFTKQRQRNFPMPDYDLGDPNRVAVRLTGRILDENYTRVLMENTEVSLMDVIALDKVQKKRALSDEEFGRLKKQGLIEGRRPNIFVSAKIAAATGDKAAYIKHRGLDKKHYQALVGSYLEKFGPSKREDLEKFLREKISDALSPEQKSNRIRNLLQELRRNNILQCEGHGPAAIWKLAKSSSDSEI